MGDSARPDSRRTLWLIGIVGSGKTSIGRAVAASTRTRFIDLDTEVAETIGVSVPEFWSLHDDRSLRQVEAGVIEQIAGSPSVVAAGDGVVFGSMDLERVRESGLVVWLRTAAENYSAGRGPNKVIAAARDDDPDATVSVLLRNRADAYLAAAHHVVDTDGLSDVEVAEEVIGLWTASR